MKRVASVLGLGVFAWLFWCILTTAGTATNDLLVCADITSPSCGMVVAKGPRGTAWGKGWTNSRYKVIGGVTTNGAAQGVTYQPDASWVAVTQTVRKLVCTMKDGRRICTTNRVQEVMARRGPIKQRVAVAALTNKTAIVTVGGKDYCATNKPLVETPCDVSP